MQILPLAYAYLSVAGQIASCPSRFRDRIGTRVIDAMPEVTAELLRRWYKHGPGEELVIKSGDGCPNPRLMEEFRRFMRVIATNRRQLRINS